MDVRLTPSPVGGRVRAPPSKSYSHRALLAGGYAGGVLVTDPLVSADTRATARAVRAFGGSVVSHHTPEDTDGSPEDPTLAGLGGSVQAIEIDGFGGQPTVPADVIRCANSGTTMRLVSATAALADGLTVLTGDSSLRSRPQGPLLEAITQLGGRGESTRGTGEAPLVIGGPMTGGTASIPGDVSSQFVSALLMAGAVTADGITIDLVTDLKSAPYVDVTIEVLAAFGVDVTETDTGYRVPGGQAYEPIDGEYAVPGDFSSLSYLLAIGAVAGVDPVEIAGATPSAQGDTAIVDILRKMGADLTWDRDTGVLTVRSAELTGIEVGVADTPDLLPTIAAVGAVADGTTRIVDAEHVRYKETDRVSAMAEELSRLGAVVEEGPDSLTVRGGESDLRGTRVDGHGDHRIVMALAVAALAAEGSTTITGADHVDVSFPDFFEVLYDLGVGVERDV